MFHYITLGSNDLRRSGTFYDAVMASAVATVLEQQFSTIAGIDSMTSTSSTGGTQITLQFALDRSIDAAAQDVQAAIAIVQRRLPSDMPAPPSLRKTNPADQPVLFLVVSSPTLPLSMVDEYAQTILSQRISTVSGVAQVQVSRGRRSQSSAINVEHRRIFSRRVRYLGRTATMSGSELLPFKLSCS